MKNKDIKPLNTKIYFKLLPENQQPRKTLIAPDGDILKKATVISVGEEVAQVVKGDIITIYGYDCIRLDSDKGVTNERSVLFKNEIPLKNKTHIIEMDDIETLNVLSKAKVIATSTKDIDREDIVYFKKGTGLILPDKTEIISDSQIFFKL